MNRVSMTVNTSIRRGVGHLSVVALLAAVAFVSLSSGLRVPELLHNQITVDYDFTNITTPDTGLNSFHITGYYTSTGRQYSGFVATFPPAAFSFYPPARDGCSLLEQPSISSASTFDCAYATNGAFFTWDSTATSSYCIGNLVSDGQVWQLPTDGTGTERANFGILSDGSAVLSGFVDSSVLQSFSFSQLITGIGWLVRNGVSYVSQSQDLTFEEGGFTMEKAPRTAVGVFANGTMLLLEVDGEEDIESGPDLFEMSELLVMLGVQSAVNLDGGGSSVSVQYGQVISQPTCTDTAEICERAVASITCVRASGLKNKNP